MGIRKFYGDRGFSFLNGEIFHFFLILSHLYQEFLRNGIGGADWFKSGCRSENMEWVLPYSFWLFFTCAFVFCSLMSSVSFFK